MKVTTMKLPIYLDYSFPPRQVDERVAESNEKCLTSMATMEIGIRSPSFGWDAEKPSKMIGGICGDIDPGTRKNVWTSGATESDNLAIKGVAHLPEKGNISLTCKNRAQGVLDTLPPKKSAKGSR